MGVPSQAHGESEGLLKEDGAISGLREEEQLNMAYAVPSSAQPVFDAEGRWIPHGQTGSSSRSAGGLERLEKGWEDAFRQIERGIVDVPKNLDDALARSQRRQQETQGVDLDEGVPGANQDWEEDFDQAGFAAFYGRKYQPGQSDEQVARNELADRLQTEIAGTSSRELDQALWNSDERFDDALSEERQERLRRAGYYQRKAEDYHSPTGQRYQFVRKNPYLQQAVDDPMGDIRGANVLQYQVRHHVQNHYNAG